MRSAFLRFQSSGTRRCLRDRPFFLKQRERDGLPLLHLFGGGPPRAQRLPLSVGHAPCLPTSLGRDVAGPGVPHLQGALHQPGVEAAHAMRPRWDGSLPPRHGWHRVHHGLVGRCDLLAGDLTDSRVGVCLCLERVRSGELDVHRTVRVHPCASPLPPPASSTHTTRHLVECGIRSDPILLRPVTDHSPVREPSYMRHWVAALDYYKTAVGTYQYFPLHTGTNI
jgi:hypothetical protein